LGLGAVGPTGAIGPTGPQGAAGASTHFARMNADGTLGTFSSQVNTNPAFTGKVAATTGQYLIAFSTNVSACVPVSTLHSDGVAGAIVGFSTNGVTSPTPRGRPPFLAARAPGTTPLVLLLLCH